MQNLTQPQINQIRRMAQYALDNIKTPELRPAKEMINPDASTIRQDAESRARPFDEYDSFNRDAREVLEYLKAFEGAPDLDYQELIDSVKTKTVKNKKIVKLGKLLKTPDKYPDIGKRSKVDIPQFNEDGLIISETAAALQTK